MGNILSQFRWHKPSLWEATKSISKASGWFGALFFGMYWMGYFLTPEKQRVAEKYHVSQDKVFIARKPLGCDFDDAPVGNKHCHFDRKEEAMRDDRGKVTAVYVTWDKVQEWTVRQDARQTPLRWSLIFVEPSVVRPLATSLWPSVEPH